MQLCNSSSHVTQPCLAHAKSVQEKQVSPARGSSRHRQLLLLLSLDTQTWLKMRSTNNASNQMQDKQ